MNELTGAVAQAQLRKVDKIITTLREKKAKLKSQLDGLTGLYFRKLNNPSGDCATLCTIIFDDEKRAKQVAARLGTVTLDQSGWHVYANMEHVNAYLKQKGLPFGKGAYPKTDDLLARSINISVGVVDAGLGAGFGIHINASDEEIEQTVKTFIGACKE
jgi:dTDP-4-amino-4,6-dideoxygalactose transaminase